MLRSKAARALGCAVTLAMALAAAPGAGAADRDEPATHEDFDRDNFSARSARVDNRWLPLVPGTQFVLKGTADRGSGQGAHTVILTVTDLEKRVNGVRSLVLWDRDFQDGELIEEELALHAQDDDGNVWNMGEYPEEHEDGKFIGAPSTWLAGRQRAQAGVMMRADPEVGTSSYYMGIAPRIDFLDEALVSEEHQRTCVPAGCYRNVLVVDEWNPLEQPDDGHQFKYHAPGVGVVRIEAKGGLEQETLVLARVRRLGPEAMAEARERALQLDRRAYRVAEDVWAGTARAERIH